ncbi:MAG: S-layer protein domain-containing protein [Methanothrix sp.]
MEIREVWLFAAAVVSVLLLGLVSLSSAQEISEAAYVRGHQASGDGVWRADDFGWFYYDIDKDLGGERLEIDLDGQEAEKGHITYSSEAWSQEFEYQPWGRYQSIAFFGKHYFAGYPETSLTEEVSSLERGELRLVRIDDDTHWTLSRNKSLPLQQGYVLVPMEVSVQKGNVNFVLFKNGEPVYASVVSIDDTFVYKVGDLPVILVHLAEAMTGADEELAEVDAVFQISDQSDLRIFDGIQVGEMKLNSFSSQGLDFQNNRSISLRRDTDLQLTPNLVLVVPDSQQLLYYPEGLIFDYGVYDIRGPVFGDMPLLEVQSNFSFMARWNAENYTGFFFDPDNDLGGEELAILSVEGRRIPQPSSSKVGLLYTSRAQPKEFEYKPWGDYYIISLFGAPYFAGYDFSIDGRRISKSLLKNEYFGQVVYDSELQGNITAGNYPLAEGYEMRIRDVGNDSLFIQLFKDDLLVDSSVVESDTTYIYSKDVENIEDLPIVMIHFGNIFNDNSHSFAAIDGIFQISDTVLPIEPGTGFGELEIYHVQAEGVIFFNHDSINLNRNSRVNIGPGMDIRVADNDTLRYYLYNQKYVVPRPEPPLINYQKDVNSSEPANFSMIVKAAEIQQVLVSIVDSSHRTVFSRNIAGYGQGEGEFWKFDWSWNATTRQINGSNITIPEAGADPVLALLYLNSSAAPIQVQITFDPDGRINAINDGIGYYYISRGEYEKLNMSSDYDSMLNNSTERIEFFRAVPGESILQFSYVIDNQWVPTGINHTMQGDLEAIEPHVIIAGADPGQYELSVRVENAVNAIWATGILFNVTQSGGALITNTGYGSGDNLLNEEPKKSPVPGILAGILALIAGAAARRRH